MPDLRARGGTVGTGIAQCFSPSFYQIRPFPEPTKPIVVIGMWLIFGPTALICVGALLWLPVAFFFEKEEQKAGQDTGHVMIVDEAPVPDGESLFRVRVIDSCESPHGKDSRAEGASGVGRGTMWFKVDESGQIVGYHWELRTGKLHDMSVAIGRAVELN